ncbi:MAG: hypothetical protein KDK70_42325, partial [Myxococcales bacterium]|nr:hypothetical protein [Myxococcales bacterium]
ASAQASVATALMHHGHYEASLPLWTEAVTVAPDDDELVEAAITSARAAGRHEHAIAWLRASIVHAAPEAASARRRRLIEMLLQRGDATSRELARVELRTLLRERPQEHELARRLADLEHDGGHPERAVVLLEQLIEQTPHAEDQVRLRLELARRLAETGAPGRAWSSLQPALELAPPALQAELLELALSLAPVSARDPLVDRLCAIDGGPRSGRALLARAQARGTAQQRLDDLETAAKRLPDPTPALLELARLADADDPAPWQRLAEACAARGDARGEQHARVELALRRLQAGELESAREALNRAHALHPEDEGLRVACALVEARAEHHDEAAARLAALDLEALPVDAEPLGDPRLGLPAAPEPRRATLGLVLLRGGRIEAALALLRPVLDHLDAGEDRALAEALQQTLEAAGQGAEASAMARRLADAHADGERARWLVVAASHAAPADA